MCAFLAPTAENPKVPKTKGKPGRKSASAKKEEEELKQLNSVNQDVGHMASIASLYVDGLNACACMQ